MLKELILVKTNNLLRRHRQLRAQLESRFHWISAKYADRMMCGKGCTRCCYGLFDISLPDSVRLASGFRGLPEEARAQVAERAALIQKKLNREIAGFRPPYHLNLFSEDQIDRLVEKVGDVRCPFLDGRDSCVIYENRPLACILEGIPMVDLHDGLFGDWCELNFKEGVAPEEMADFRLDYCGIQEIEQDVTVFIPSVVCVELHPST